MQFTTYHAMSTVLDIFEQAGLLQKNTVSRYKAISNTYCSEGFRGLLKYEIDNSRKVKYDKNGNRVRNKRYASSLKGKKINNFTLSKVSRFYETEVKSYFGQQLIEYGFPVDAIKRIEDENIQLITLDTDSSRKYIKEHIHRINQVLDEYEETLLNKALRSIF